MREELIADLRALEDENGPLFENVYKGEEVYSGPFVDAAPEVVLDQRVGVHVNDGVGGGRITADPDRWAAENTLNGIFVASGPDFEADGRLDRISILDIAPTLLTAHDCAVPTDMEGDRLDIVAGEPATSSREPISLAETERQENTVAVEDRLKDLGYME